jgi:tetratricopeptide (TPR) repeat protein
MRQPGEPFTRPSSKTKIPDAARNLPEDVQNTAPQTRARYRYQDECAALAILGHLQSADLEGILIERSTDLILIPNTEAAQLPELVSIKHREPSQLSDSNWSMQSLRKENVLRHLYSAWNEAERKCTVAFWTNSGFNAGALPLWKACSGSGSAPASLIKSLARDLGATNNDVLAFLAALSIPQQPLPRRNEITDVAIRRVSEFLEDHRPGGRAYAEQVYNELQKIIAEAGTDLPENDPIRKNPSATLAAIRKDQSELKLRLQYISAHQIRNQLLRAHDVCSSDSTLKIDNAWAPDPHFVGRAEHLLKLERLLKPGIPAEVKPVVIHGVTGCGKTSLATQFAATHRSAFRSIFISASSRSTLISELTRLISGKEDFQDGQKVWGRGISEIRGPITPQLPWTSATLLIIDGVDSIDTIQGIVPRGSLCRVILTTTLSHVDQGFEHIELDGWGRSESIHFISSALPDSPESECVDLARRLFDHPLAITQAINYLQMTKRSVTDYIIKLSETPLETLDLGKASGHIESVVKSIKLNMDLALVREPAAVNLLFIFSFIGSRPVNIDVFDEEWLLPYVNLPTRKKKGRLTRLRSDRFRHGLDFTVTTEAQTVLSGLSDRAARDHAADTLIGMSLLRPLGHSVMIHPLISLVGRKLAGDPTQWIELAIGMFGKKFTEPTASVNDFDSYLDHFVNLAIVADDADLNGPAVMAILLILASRLPLLAPPDTRWADRFTAIDFCRKAVDVSRLAVSGGWAGLQYLLRARTALAQALYSSGKFGESMYNLTMNIELLKQVNEPDMLFDAMLDLAWVASDGDQVYVQEALTQLQELPEVPNVDPERVARHAITRVRLLRRLGRISEAAEIISSAVSAEDLGAKLSPHILESLFAVAATIARDTRSKEDAFKYEQAALAASRTGRTGGQQRPDSEFLSTMISAADGAIEVREYTQAEAILLEAEPLVIDNFGKQSLLYARFLTARGRLWFDQDEWTKALPMLRAAVQIYRDASSFNRGEMPAPLLHLGQAAFFLGSYQEAADSVLEAYEIDLREFGADHPETKFDVDVIDALATLAALLGLDRSLWEQMPLSADARSRIDSIRSSGQ